MTRLRKLAVMCTVTAALAFAGESLATDPAPFTARAGLDLAADAANTWAPDARLIYVENDEDVRLDGKAVRWGYLFYSQRKGDSRGYSLRGGKILEATDLSFDFDAPPLTDDWIDSYAALLAAEKKAGLKFRTDHEGRLSTVLLIRGAFDQKKPNSSTWTFVYTSDTAPALFVVVDAASGDVVRTWRG